MAEIETIETNTQKKLGLKDITNPRQRYLDWCIVINNYSDNDIENLRSVFNTCNALYACIGKEVGANGTPHLQAHQDGQTYPSCSCRSCAMH